MAPSFDHFSFKRHRTENFLRLKKILQDYYFNLLLYQRTLKDLSTLR